VPDPKPMISTECPQCGGLGASNHRYGAITRREPGQMFTGIVPNVTCQACKGTGWIPITTP
jgi:RecJ-like exonuclease